MSQQDREKWDKRWADADAAEARPMTLLEGFSHLLPRKGRALDLACGLGGNARLLAQHGLETEAWDISPIAIEKLQQRADALTLPIHAMQRDVEEHTPAPHMYDVITVSQFLDRALLPHLAEALQPGGLLFYQTFTAEKQGSDGPSNPHFLLKPNELLMSFPTLRIIYYREEGAIGDCDQGLRDVAQLIATTL